MMAITIWQPWASLIMAGCKPFEFRRWPAPRRVVGERIVIHAGARPVRRGEVAELLARLRDPAERRLTGLDVGPSIELLERVHLTPGILPLSSGLGTAILGKPRRATALLGGTVANPDRIDQHVWAWPLTAIERFEPVVPARGAQGFWRWPEADGR